MARLPMAKLGRFEISRLMIGGNPFGGGSHFSEAKNRWLRRLLTYEAIVEILEKCDEEGINAFLGRGDDHVFRILNEYEKRTGRRMNWIAQTAPERGPHPGRHPLNTPTSIDEIVKHNPIGIYIQGSSVVDRLLDLDERKIDHVQEWLELIKNHGILAGIGSHCHQTIDICEERGYDPDFYMMTLNPLGFLCSEDPARISQSIRATAKPVLAFKVLAAGRTPPEEAFKFALSSIKDTDFIVVGMAFPEEVEENANLIRTLARS